MHRYTFRLTLLLCGFFGVLLILIRTQPFDERARYQRFVSEGCQAACFMGIQPGVTKVDEALKILEASPWISAVDNRTINNVSGFISWTWSDQKPNWISGKQAGQIWATQKQIVNVVIYGDLLLGDTRLALGSPDQEVIDRTEDRKGLLSLYTAFYGQMGLMIQSWQPCNVLEPLRRPVIMTIMIKADPKLFPERDTLDELHHTCPIYKP